MEQFISHDLNVISFQDPISVSRLFPRSSTLNPSSNPVHVKEQGSDLSIDPDSKSNIASVDGLNTVLYDCRKKDPSSRPRHYPSGNMSTNIGNNSNQQPVYNPDVVTNTDPNIVSDYNQSLSAVSNLYDHLLLMQILCPFSIIVDHHYHCY